MNAIYCLLMSCFVFVGAHAATKVSEPLHYEWKADHPFVYEVEIVADEPDEVATYKGLAEYGADVDGKIHFRGGLTKSTKKKPSHRSPSPGFRPPAAMHFGVGGPFSRRVNPFKGLESTRNVLELDLQGRVISLEGSSQLPYLLGHLSLLPFEPFDLGQADEWVVKDGVVITEARDRVEPSFPFGAPRGPFSPRREDPSGKQTAGGQVNVYRVLKASEQAVEIEKTVRLTTAIGKDAESLSVEGQGTWTLNRKEHLPESLSYTHKVIYTLENAVVTVPVSIRFQRLSDEAWGKIVAERKAENSRRKAEQAKRIAEQQSQAEAALSPEERSAALEDLAARSAKVLRVRLKKLSTKKSQEADADLAEAIRPLTRHVDGGIRADAEKALATYDPDYGRVYPLLIAYRKGEAVEETPFPVSPDMELPLGLVVLYHERGKWMPGKVIGESESGQVEMKQVRWPHRDHVAPRSELRLADLRAEQPHVSSEDLSGLYGRPSVGEHMRIALRTWTDHSGSFQMEGAYEQLAGGQVHLRLKNGKAAQVPLEKLSPSDQAYVQRIQKAPKVQNPFEIEE